MFNFILVKGRLKNMVFKRKKAEEEVEDIESEEEVIYPEASEIKTKDSVEELANELDTELNSILANFNNRIQVLEATIFRLKNI